MTGHRRPNDNATESLMTSTPDVPAAYDRMFHQWTVLGFLALFAFLVIFWLMVAKRLPWAD